MTVDRLAYCGLVVLSLIASSVSATASASTASKDIIVTWGGNRISSQTQDPNYYEPSLESVCVKSNYASAVHIMGVLQFYGPNNQIGIGLANHCNRVFPGFTRPSSGFTVLSCPSIGNQIKKCQSLGKRVLISLVNSISPPVMKSDEDGIDIADKIWKMFLGGGKETSVRPFGDAVLDGVDIWMRDNQVAGYSAMANRFRELYVSDPSKTYYLSGSPRCSFPEPLFANPDQGPLLTQGGSHNFDYLSIYAESSPDCSFLNTDLFLSTFGKWAAWAKTAGHGESRLPLYLAIPANNFVSAPGDYISIQARSVLSKLPSDAIDGIHLNDYSVDIATQPCKNDARTYGQLMRDFFQGGQDKVSTCTPNAYSDGISGKPSGGDKGGSGIGSGGGDDFEDLDSAAAPSLTGGLVFQSIFTAISLFIAFFVYASANL